MSESNEVKGKSSNQKRANRNRWFALGLGFLVLNAWAVLRMQPPGSERVPVVAVEASRTLGTNKPLPPANLLKQRGEVRWQFTEAMVEEDETHTWQEAGPFAFDPPHAGMFRWDTRTELIFKPRDNWPTGRTVRVRMVKPLRTVSGKEIQLSENTFTTEKLALLGAEVDSSQEHLRLRFNTLVRPEEVAKHARAINLETGEEIPIQAIKGVASLNVRLKLPRLDAAKIRLEIASDLRPANGEHGMEQPIRKSFVIGKPLTLKSHQPKMYSFREGAIYLKFTTPVSLEQLRGKIVLEPHLPFQVLESDHWWWGNCRVQADFKPGTSYKLTIHAGVQPQRGWPSKNEFVCNTFMPSKPPGLTFLHGGTHLSSNGKLQVPINSTNLDNLEVSVSRIYPNNLVFFGMRNHNRYGAFYGYAYKGLSEPVVKNVTIPVIESPNKQVETYIDLGKLLPQPRAGVYHVDIKDKGSSKAARKIIHLTDIGTTLLHSDKELLVWANSLTTLDPVAQAKVVLYSDANQVLAEGRTGPDGLARIPVPGQPDAVPFLLTVEKGNNTASLFLDETRIHTVTAAQGRPYLDNGAEAHLFADRGIYRPGETARLKAIIRDAQGQPPTPHPVELRRIGPDKKEGQRLHGILSPNGTVEFELTWPDSAKLGKYAFLLAIPGTEGERGILGSCTASLEEFTAAKLEVAINTDDANSPLHPGSDFKFTVSARHLAGRPASMLPAYAHVRYLPTESSHEGWDAFTFVDKEKQFPSEKTLLEAIGRNQLDESGQATFQLEVPHLDVPSGFEAQLIATVNDVAGRPVSFSETLAVQAYPFHVGLRKADRPNHFEAAVLTPDNNPAPDGTKVLFSVYRVTRTLLLRKDDTGDYRYQSERHLQEFKTLTVESRDGLVSYQHPLNPAAGTYVIRAQHPNSAASATVEFHVEEPGSPSHKWAGEEPERVELSFDRPDYSPGETATLRIAAPFEGKALITLQQDQIQQTRVIEIGPHGTGSLQFEAEEAFFPNAWATVNVIRQVALNEPSWQPRRAFGSTSLRINADHRRLRLEIEAPESTRPLSTMQTAIRLTDSQGKPVEAELALWMIDEGVLSLTGYQTPNPLEYFTADRRPGFRLHDPYGLLLPETDVKGIQKRLAVGAGAGSYPSNYLNTFKARRFENFALWKPAIQTDASGHAQVNWDLPEFSGKVRLMVVAADGARIGTAQKHIIVKRPFTVTSGLPRFLAPGDQFSMPVRLFNDSEEPLDINWKVEPSEHLEILHSSQKAFESTTSVSPAGMHMTNVPIRVGNTPGAGWIQITAEAGGESYKERINISIRPAAAREFDVHSGVLLAGQTININPGSRFLNNTAAGRLETSTTPDALLGPALESLLKYPYGCLEQTTSGSLPLLYAEDLLKRVPSGKPPQDYIQDCVQAGIHRVLSMQNPNGAFGWWPGSTSPFHWGTLYATQFLLEARKAGFEVPDAELKKATAWIRDNLGKEKASGRDSLVLRSYAIQVLAQADQLPAGWLKRMWEVRDQLTVVGRIHLAVAHIHHGDRRKAAELAKDLHIPSWKQNSTRSWQTLGSALHTCALLLGLHVELDPDSARTVKLAISLQDALKSSGFWTTKENAMLVLAMGKYARHLGESSRETKVLIVFDGEPMESESARQSHPFVEGKLPGKLRLKNQGPAPLYYSFTVDGTPAKSPEPRADGLRIIRTIQGTEGAVRRGDVLKVELIVDTFGNEIDHLVIQDLLPAGLEIETSDNHKTIRHKEHRDDRFLLFPNSITGTRKFNYLARAVTAGTFTLPAPTATCMYDADTQAVGEGGVLTIVEEK